MHVKFKNKFLPNHWKCADSLHCAVPIVL